MPERTLYMLISLIIELMIVYYVVQVLPLAYAFLRLGVRSKTPGP